MWVRMQIPDRQVTISVIDADSINELQCQWPLCTAISLSISFCQTSLALTSVAHT
jgi:hypothetical protein